MPQRTHDGIVAFAAAAVLTAIPPTGAHVDAHHMEANPMPLSVDRTARNDGRAVAETTRSGMAHAAWAERTRGLRTLLATVSAPRAGLQPGPSGVISEGPGWLMRCECEW